MFRPLRAILMWYFLRFLTLLRYIHHLDKCEAIYIILCLKRNLLKWMFALQNDILLLMLINFCMLRAWLASTNFILVGCILLRYSGRRMNPWTRWFWSKLKAASRCTTWMRELDCFELQLQVNQRLCRNVHFNLVAYDPRFHPTQQFAFNTAS
jgi:hypothetical protein